MAAQCPQRHTAHSGSPVAGGFLIALLFFCQTLSELCYGSVRNISYMLVYNQKDLYLVSLLKCRPYLNADEISSKNEIAIHAVSWLGSFLMQPFHPKTSTS